MRKIPPIFVIVICFYKLTYSQDTIWYNWNERNSGVTTQLNCAAVPTTSYQYESWICGVNGVVLRTTNYGVNWQNVGVNGIPTNVDLVTIWIIGYVSPYTIVTAGNDASNTYVYRTTNGGQNWILIFSQNGGRIRGIRFGGTSVSNEGIMVGDPVGGRWSLWKSTVSGANWDSTGRFLQQAGNERSWDNSIWTFMYSSGDASVWIGTDNSRIYYSSNFGLNWVTRIMQTEQNIYSVCFGSGGVGFAGGANLLKTTNNGVNWFQVSVPGSGNILSIGLFYPPPPSGDIVCIRNDNHIYYTENNGLNWLTYTASAGNYRHVNSVYNMLEGHFYQYAVRTNGGISYRVMYVGGIKQIGNVIPSVFALHQNYPNPFNPVTKIKFDIPPTPLSSIGEGPGVRLIVYDVLGREVATLVNEQLKPGTYEVEWDGTNYASGVYFYKLVSGNYTETRKMVLLK